VEEVEALFAKPFMDLIFEAQQVHRQTFDANRIQVSRLISIKTGSCPEDCSYCPQSAHYATGLEKEKLMAVEEVVEAARKAKEEGASRFCMGAAWRGPRGDDFDVAVAMIEGVKALGMETCATFGLLDKWQAQRLKEAGLDYYNHNLDTAPEFYGDVISTRDYQDRLDTLARVRAAGLAVCCGGIVGMGESRRQRAGLIAQLARLAPESVPINHLVQIEGTPLHARFGGEPAIDPLEFVRTIAVTRIAIPRAMIRLSAGRRELGEAVQALCYFAGANSIFYGDKLLTTGNPDVVADRALFDKLGLVPA
jgi:biotin synthase